MLTVTENEMRLTAAGQTPCEECVTNKSAVTKEELSKPKTRSRVVFKHQLQKIETSIPESKANITENIDSEAKTEDEKSEQTADVVKSFSKCVVALRATASGKDDSKQPTTFGVSEAAVVKKLEAKPAAGEKLTSKPPAKVEKPSKLSERNLIQSHQPNREKPSQLSERNLLQNLKLKVEKPSQLSSRNLLRNHQLKVEKPSLLSAR